MSKNAMAGAVTLCGVGLCMIGGALMMQSGNSAHAGSTPAAVVAVAAVTHAQAMPTVVWYQVHDGGSSYTKNLWRAWSDGTVELKRVNDYAGEPCYPNIGCTSPWIQVTTSQDGYRAAADINADEKVDAPDLAAVLTNWGDAPRVPFPASDCPLNLINP